MKIAILGYGTVGSGVYEIITNGKPSELEKIEVKSVFARSRNKMHLATDDINEIINDEEISVVVECLGGLSPAYDFIKRSLENGKHVVTANKAVAAKYLDEFVELAEKNNVKFIFEASVGGGIPWLVNLERTRRVDEVKRVYGIFNGTSNFILDNMYRNDQEFDSTLKTAQELGYAEADPTYDVDGIDAGHKINILASLAYGGSIKFKDMQISGIREINTLDIFSANQLNSTIKLVASSKLITEDTAQISVEPVIISNNEILAKVDDVYNAIETIGSYTGKTLFYGKGAGMDPTASAVVADIVKIATRNHIESDYFFNSTKIINIIDSNAVKDNYYIRVSDDFNVENSPFNVYNKIDNFFRRTSISGRDKYFFTNLYILSFGIFVSYPLYYYLYSYKLL